MNDYIEYVLGFIFSGKRDCVCLLRKTHPDWQKGLLNGCGGRIEEGEEPLAAMIREASEEVGLTAGRYDYCWREFARLHGANFLVHCFVMVSDLAFDEATTRTNEVIEYHSLPLDRNLKAVGNLHWLVPLAVDRGYPESGPAMVIAGYGVEPAPVDMGLPSNARLVFDRDTT